MRKEAAAAPTQNVGFAPQLMRSVAEAVDKKRPCDGCLMPSNDLVNNDGDQLCQKCRDIFWTAQILIEHGVGEEEELIPTLVCARNVGLTPKPEDLRPHPQVARYPVVEQIRVVDDVPIMRALLLIVKPEEHTETQVLRQVYIQVLAKHVEPTDVREKYEQVLANRAAQWKQNNHGRLSYQCLVGPILQLTVEAGPNLTPLDVEGLGGDPLRHPAWHFPAPALVAGFYSTLRGSLKGENPDGFAYALDLYGKPNSKTARRIVPAFVAWHLGANIGPRAGEEVNSESRLRVARLLNKHLLSECDMRLVPEDSRYRCSGDVVWQDVAVLWPRFVRLQALLG